MSIAQVLIFSNNGLIMDVLPPRRYVCISGNFACWKIELTIWFFPYLCCAKTRKRSSDVFMSYIENIFFFFIFKVNKSGLIAFLLIEFWCNKKLDKERDSSKMENKKWKLLTENLRNDNVSVVVNSLRLFLSAEFFDDG